MNNLALKAECVYGDDATHELPSFIPETSLFDKTQTTMQSICLNMQIVPMNLLNAKNSMQSITGKLVIAPYPDNTDYIVLKTNSLICKNINSIIFDIGRHSDITPVHFADNAFSQ
jgi:hypothetical protein